MRVRDLNWKPPENLPCIDGAAKIRDAAIEMRDQSVSALLVLGENRTLLGILTERDITRFFASEAYASAATVHAAMTADVITCTLDHEVSEILRTMSTSNIRHLPVTDRGQPVGILNLRDIVRDHVSTLESENQTLRNLVAALD